MGNKTTNLESYLDENLSEATGIPIKELTLVKVHELLDETDTNGTLKSKMGGKIGVRRVFISRKQWEVMRKENEEFLEKYRK